MYCVIIYTVLLSCSFYFSFCLSVNLSVSSVPSVAAGSLGDLGVAARTLACIADVLGCMAGEGKGGLRSGPAANPAWATAFSLLEQGKLEAGVLELANQRTHWLNR